MAKHHPLQNPSRYKWDTSEVTVYQIPIEENLYQQKLDRVAEVLYSLLIQRSEVESSDSPDSSLPKSHPDKDLQNLTQGTGTSSTLERLYAHEKNLKDAA